MPIGLYPSEVLPHGFSYPAEFLQLASSSAVGLYPWWLIDANSKAGELMLRVTLGNGRALVPFAKTDLQDDLACFNAGTTSVDPEIVMVCSTPEREYGFKNFAAWHAQAIREVSEFLHNDTEPAIK